MYPSCTCCHLSIIRRFFISCTSSLSLLVLPLSCVKENHRVLRLWSPLLRQPGHRASLSSPCLPGGFHVFVHVLISPHSRTALRETLCLCCGLLCRNLHSQRIDSYSAGHIWFKWSGFWLTASVCTEQGIRLHCLFAS